MGRDHTTPICQRSLQPSNNSKTKIRVVVIFSLGWLMKFYMWLKLPQALRLRNWLFCLAAVLGGLFQEKAKWLLDCWLLLCILTIFQFVFNLSISFLHSRPTVYFELFSTGLIMLRVFFLATRMFHFLLFGVSTASIESIFRLVNNKQSHNCHKNHLCNLVDRLMLSCNVILTSTHWLKSWGLWSSRVKHHQPLIIWKDKSWSKTTAHNMQNIHRQSLNTWRSS